MSLFINSTWIYCLKNIFIDVIPINTLPYRLVIICYLMNSCLVTHTLLCSVINNYRSLPTICKVSNIYNFIYIFTII